MQRSGYGLRSLGSVLRTTTPESTPLYLDSEDEEEFDNEEFEEDDEP